MIKTPTIAATRPAIRDNGCQSKSRSDEAAVSDVIGVRVVSAGNVHSLAVELHATMAFSAGSVHAINSHRHAIKA
jgi:hypothetical protein